MIQLLKLALIALVSLPLNAQVGIGTTAPQGSSILQLSATNRGFMPPKVALTGLNDNTTVNNAGVPLTATDEGLMVYNTANTGVDENRIVKGYYVWNGLKWIQQSNAVPESSSPTSPMFNLGTNQKNVPSGIDSLFIGDADLSAGNGGVPLGAACVDMRETSLLASFNGNYAPIIRFKPPVHSIATVSNIGKIIIIRNDASAEITIRGTIAKGNLSGSEADYVLPGSSSAIFALINLGTNRPSWYLISESGEAAKSESIYTGDGTTPADVDITVTDNIDIDTGTLFINGSMNQVGIGTSSPHVSSLLDLNTTDKAFLLPRLTKTQMFDIPSPTGGQLIYCINCCIDGGSIFLYNGHEWRATLNACPEDRDLDGLDDAKEVDNNANGILDANEDKSFQLTDDFGSDATANRTGTLGPSGTCKRKQLTAPNYGDNSFANTAVGLADGEYGVEVSMSCASNAIWEASPAGVPNVDHTPLDNNGYMLVVNATGGTTDAFYGRSLTGLPKNTNLQITLYIANIIDNASYAKPNVRIKLINKNVVPEQTISEQVIGVINSTDWLKYSVVVNTGPYDALDLEVLDNSAVAIAGNDLAIDDIGIQVTNGDTDGDMIADNLDLDSDNDGVPNILEIQPGNAIIPSGKDEFGPGSSFPNGLDDSFEPNGLSLDNAPDTDNIGLADFLTTDSDGDGTSDTDEYSITLTGQDKDGDGLDDAIDIIDGFGYPAGVFTPTSITAGDTNIRTYTYINPDANGNGVLDYRE
ncbi:MAG: hypothetical protein N4A45_07510 [Flavobacteriales bacterium]|jgi:hypothetical protein|nr:hypothetical protein [Flavobacteriales bacterium]